MSSESNRKAFLDTIAWSEICPDLLALSDNGYNIIVGSTPKRPFLFDSYADHPRRPIYIPKIGNYSTAAGRYQILARYFDAYKRLLALPDFGRESQDRIAMQMITECGALQSIDAGRLSDALLLCKSRWASLPGAGYGQHEQVLADLTRAYVTAGGILA